MKQQIIVLATTALVTFIIRALPFFFGTKLSESKYLKRFSDILTPALIGMLVVYCLKDVSFANTTGFASLISVLLCVVTYCWKRNSMISIVVPTLVYMFLLQSEIF